MSYIKKCQTATYFFGWVYVRGMGKMLLVDQVLNPLKTNPKYTLAGVYGKCMLYQNQIVFNELKASCMNWCGGGGGGGGGGGDRACDSRANAHIWLHLWI